MSIFTKKTDWKPHSYQDRATEFCLSNPYALVLADPGMGKTSITLNVIKKLKERGEIDKVLIVAPLRPAYEAWPNEINKWKNFKDLTYTIIDSKNKSKAIKEDVDIYIVTTDLVKWLFNAEINPDKKRARPVLNSNRIGHLNFSMLVIDELSKFKNNTSMRTRVMYEVSSLFDKRIGLTGSFAPNHLLDVFAETKIIAGDNIFGKYITSFKNTYFNSPIGMNRSFEILQPKQGAFEAICKALSPVSIHLKAEDYLDMPDKLFINLEATLSSKAMDIYKGFEKEFVAFVNSNVISTQNAATKAIMLRQIASGGIYRDAESEETEGIPWKIKERVSEVVHNAKTDILIDLISELQGKPLLLLYHFKHDKERINKAFGNIPCLNDAKTPEKLRAMVDLWNRGEIPILLGQPQSMGHGLNLQKGGNHICFYTLDWSFENYDQVIRRIYRQGNEHKTVYIYHILAKNTIDYYVLQKLQNKEDTQDSILKYLKEYCLEEKA